MYKYLPIADNLQEMMVMLKSLPAYTLVFDIRSNLVDMNQPAQQLFRVNNVQEFNKKRGDIFQTRDYIKMIIYELKKGNTIRDAKTLIKHDDESYTIIESCACMINGHKDLFLFQLFEISVSTSSDLGSFTSYSNNDTQDIDNNQINDSIKNTKDVIMLYKRSKMQDRLNKRRLENSPVLLEKFKHRELTEIESTVSSLLALNMSIQQIANLTNKKNATIRSIIRRVLEKRKMNDGFDKYSYGYNGNEAN